MGMYSSFGDEEIEVRDWEGLVEFMKFWKREIPEHFVNSYKEFKMLDEETKDFSFECWDEIKLISYWYPEDVVFLKCVAKYIEGYVKFEFENDDEGGWIEFKNGECIIHTGQMMWNENSAEEMYNYSHKIFFDDVTKKKEHKLDKIMMLGEFKMRYISISSSFVNKKNVFCGIGHEKIKSGNPYLILNLTLKQYGNYITHKIPICKKCLLKEIKKQKISKEDYSEWLKRKMLKKLK